MDFEKRGGFISPFYFALIIYVYTTSEPYIINVAYDTISFTTSAIICIYGQPEAVRTTVPLSQRTSTKGIVISFFVGMLCYYHN